MGVRGWFKRVAARKAARRMEERYPMLNRLINWLNEKPGRKRGVAAVLAVVAGFVRFVEVSIERLCEAGTLSGRACTVDPEPVAMALSPIAVARADIVVSSTR